MVVTALPTGRAASYAAMKQRKSRAKVAGQGVDFAKHRPKMKAGMITLRRETVHNERPF